MTRTHIALLVLTCLAVESRVHASAIGEATAIANGHTSISQAYDGQKTSGEAGIVSAGGGYQKPNTIASPAPIRPNLPLPGYSVSKAEPEKVTTANKAAAVGLMGFAGYLLSVAIPIFAGTAALTGLLPVVGAAIAGGFAYALLTGKVRIFN